MCIPIYWGLPIYFMTILIMVIIFQSAVDHKDRLIHYYRQPGYEATLSQDMQVLTGSICVTMRWDKDEGKIYAMTNSNSHIELYIPCNEDEWREMEPVNQFTQLLQIYNKFGDETILVKWRPKNTITI